MARSDDRRQMKDRESFLDGDDRILRDRARKNLSPAQSPHAQFGIFLQGTGTFVVGDKKWNVKKGDGYFIPPGVFHELPTRGTEVVRVVDFFTPEREDFLKEASEPDV